jgi:hypothetical protein
MTTVVQPTSIKCVTTAQASNYDSCSFLSSTMRTNAKCGHATPPNMFFHYVFIAHYRLSFEIFIYRFNNDEKLVFRSQTIKFVKSFLFVYDHLQ